MSQEWNDGRPNWDGYEHVNVGLFIRNEPVLPISDSEEIRQWQEKIDLVEKAVGPDIELTDPIRKNDFSGKMEVAGVLWEWRVWPASFNNSILIRERDGTTSQYRIWIPTLLTHVKNQEQYTNARNAAHVYGRAMESVIVRRAWPKMEGIRR